MKSPAEMLEALGQPFPANAVEKRKGAGGRMYDYVAAETVIRRLNNATNGDWSFIVNGHEWRGDVLITWGELTIPGLGTRSGFGVQAVAPNAGEDLIKGSASDCLKKCATQFGVALELYGPDLEAGEIAAPQQRPPQRAPQAPQRPQNAPKPANTTTDPDAPKDMRAEALGRTLHSLAEHDFLHALAVKWGFESFAQVPADNRQLALDYLNGKGEPAKLQAFHTFRRQWEEQEKRASLKPQANGLLPGVDVVPNPRPAESYGQ